MMINDRWLLRKYEPESLVFKAYKFAQKAHKGVNRKDGSSYIEHPLAVAKIINDWGFDNLTIGAALLHDVIEDTNYKFKDIKDNFGEEIAFLVSGLTKIESLKYKPNEESDKEKGQAENMRKLVVALAQDLRVIFIKLADRLHNMKTLGALSDKQQKRISAETIDVYATLAYRLGMQKLSGELEDLAFPYLHPKEFKWLRNQVEGRYEERKRYAKKAKPVLEDILKKEGVKIINVDARAKRYFSLYQKLKRHDMQFDKIYDLVALRVVVENISDCYESLGAIHKHWPPMPGRIKDYIAMPKPNGYRSLHTTVFCLENKITEIQIRTQKMHEEAEMGAAAHWSYQQARISKKFMKGKKWKTDESEIEWVKQLRDWEKNFRGSDNFLKSLKVDFFKDRIFVITPEHEVIDLPDESTPVDFAYRIHTEVGNQCVGAKVNEKIVPLNYKLCSGDVVEILTQKGKKPSESWLGFVKTEIARSKIKNVFRSKTNIFKNKHIEPKTTFRITIKDRPGILKDVTFVFSQNRINIENSQTQSRDKGNFGSIRITCKEIKENKIDKILVKLKKIKGVIDISYKQER